MRVQFHMKHIIWLIVACAVALGMMRLAQRSFFAGWFSVVLVMGLLWAGVEAGEQTRRAVVAVLDRRRPDDADELPGAVLLKFLIAFVCGIAVMLAIWGSAFFSMFYLSRRP